MPEVDWNKLDENQWRLIDFLLLFWGNRNGSDFESDLATLVQPGGYCDQHGLLYFCPPDDVLDLLLTAIPLVNAQPGAKTTHMTALRTLLRDGNQYKGSKMWEFSTKYIGVANPAVKPHLIVEEDQKGIYQPFYHPKHRNLVVVFRRPSEFGNPPLDHVLPTRSGWLPLLIHCMTTQTAKIIEDRNLFVGAQQDPAEARSQFQKALVTYIKTSPIPQPHQPNVNVKGLGVYIGRGEILNHLLTRPSAEALQVQPRDTRVLSPSRIPVPAPPSVGASAASAATATRPDPPMAAAAAPKVSFVEPKTTGRDPDAAYGYTGQTPVAQAMPRAPGAATGTTPVAHAVPKTPARTPAKTERERLIEIMEYSVRVDDRAIGAAEGANLIGLGVTETTKTATRNSESRMRLIETLCKPGDPKYGTPPGGKDADDLEEATAQQAARMAEQERKNQEAGESTTDNPFNAPANNTTARLVPPFPDGATPPTNLTAQFAKHLPTNKGPSTLPTANLRSNPSNNNNNNDDDDDDSL